MQRILYILLLFVILPVSAQDRFITLNWQELPAAQTLPEVAENIPLPDDFRFYDYKVKIEYPEFVDLDPEAAAELVAKKVSLPDYPQAETTVGISAHKGFLDVRFIPVVYRGGVYQRINSFKISLISTPVPVAARASRVSAATRTTTENSVLSSGRFVKIRVSDSGVYRITSAALRNMGFSNPAKVRLYGYGGYLLSTRFSEHPADDLPEVPVYRGGDGILFYARGTVSWQKVGSTFTRVKNFYSDYAYYFLTENDEAPAEFTVEDGTGSSTNRIETFDAYTFHENDAYSWSGSGRELYDSYDYSVGNTQNYSFRLPGITDDNGRIKVAFTTRTVGVSTTLVAAINGVNVGTQTIAGISNSDPNAYYKKAIEAILDQQWTGSKTESTTVTLTHNRATGVPGRLNYIVLNYKRWLDMNGAYLTFRSTASQSKESTFVISGANSSTVVWDITSPNAYKLIRGTLEGDTYTFTIPPSSTLREFVAVNTSGSFDGVESVGKVPNQNLHALNGVDMVIIVPDRAGFIQQAERLAQAHREKDGLTVEIVKAPLIYNEFSSGTPDATAYRRLMKMLYDRSKATDEHRLQYLLLFGDCSYDNRMITSSWRSYKPSDFLLSYQFENSVDETLSFMTDDYFGFLDDREGTSFSTDLLDIGIGRFPVRTVAEAKVAVDKTIDYMNNKNAGSWKRTVVFVADDAADKDSNGFMDQACHLADTINTHFPYMRPERILADAYKKESSATGNTYPQATRRLLHLFEQGMLLVDYTGHSGTTSWSAENLLTSADIVKLSSPRLPIWFTASCEFTRFDAAETSAGELAFLNEKGGAIALFSTSRVVFDGPNDSLNVEFIKHFFSMKEGKRPRLGDIVRQAKTGKNYIRNGSNKLNFNLTGDPALTPAYPDHQVVVDELDGPLADELPYVKAGAKVTVKGHILTPDGEPADDFTGTIHPLLCDSKETVSTLNGSDKGAVTYTDHIKTLFSGMDSVHNGRFELTFPVPLDINYSNEQGLLNFYACSSDKREAGGAFNNFLVGGTADDLSTDGDGPKMMLYLNTPDFPWGGQVNETPYFFAELEDEDGINTVGNGIGHDLSLCIDGKITYSLNDYYTPLAGSYTKGTVAYSIPALTEGKHSLVFRAWDIMNNSSVQSLDFEVVKGLQPDLLSISCTNSPARESTTFILSHDRAGSQLDVRIAVCDFAGRELWVHTEQGVSAGSYYYIDWDLCSNAGQRLSPGIYLYRASITCGDSKESTKTEKIVILAQ